MSFENVEDYVKNAENNRNPAILNALLQSEPGMKELPNITVEDEGKFLAVDNGAPAWISGSSSSGGGVLVVHQTVTQDGDDKLYTLDKTYAEIVAAGYAVKTDDSYGNTNFEALSYFGEDDGTYYVSFTDGIDFEADSADGTLTHISGR